MTLLAVFAHPDDEALSAGGLIADRAAAGWRTEVVTATWGADTVRATELAAALRILGAGAPRMLGYADSRVPASAPGRPRWLDVPLDEAVGRLVAHLREIRPSVVVTHDGYGGVTGHQDHRHTHRVTMLAVQAAGLGQLYPEAGEPWRPQRLLLATHPHSALPDLRRLIGARRTAYSTPDDEIVLRLEVSRVDDKVAAVLAHRSEVERGALPGIVAGLSDEDRIKVLGRECYAESPIGSVPTR